MNLRLTLVALGLCMSVHTLTAEAANGQKLDVAVRGKTLTLTVYLPEPGRPVRGTIFMASGDVGWVGLATTLADFLSDERYVVAGINARQYLSVFAEGGAHLEIDQVPGDYGVLAAALRSRGWLSRPVILAGVSEGAALAVAAAASPVNRPWVDGVLTMGLPATAELAWQWKDVLAWVMKKDTGGPSFNPHDIIGRIAPVPLWMIQSTRDEYVQESDYRRFERMANEPKKLVLMDAKNHRFTDRIPQLKEHVLAGIAWLARF